MLPMVEYVLEIQFMAIRIILTIISYQNDTLIVNLKIVVPEEWKELMKIHS